MVEPGQIRGIAVAPGLAIAPVHVVRAAPDKVPTWSVPPGGVDHEIERLETALTSTREQFLYHQATIASEAGEKDAEIFAVHGMMLQDAGALEQLKGTICDERINAEAAVQKLINRLEERLGDRFIGDSTRSFAADITDPWRAVLDTLIRGDREDMLSADTPVILAAAELTPQVMTFLERNRLRGVMTEAGGRFSHGAVLARAFGVPCVVGLTNLVNRLEQGMIVTVDGDRGTVRLSPTEADINAFEEQMSTQEERRQKLRGQASLPAETSDGHPLEVSVNIESLRDMDTFDVSTTDGVGLLRTEFLYMERSQFPSEDEQFRLYRRFLETMEGRPIVLRTLDIGGDKQLSYFKTPPETNPALGWRGLRISLQWQDLLRVQLRAALRAGYGHDLRILLPMVTSLEEVRTTRKIFQGVRDSLLGQGYPVASDVPVGVMIEVPSVLFVLSEIAKEVDFMSVGTNDLVQYLLAVDRDNAWVADLYEPYDPAVLSALKHVADVARQAGKRCSVCGDIADDPATALLLLGMGYDGVSVAPHFVPEIKFGVRKVSVVDARKMARDALAQKTAAGVIRVLSKMRDLIHRLDSN